MQLWKHQFRGRALIVAITAASCQAFLLLGFDQGEQELNKGRDQGTWAG